LNLTAVTIHPDTQFLSTQFTAGAGNPGWKLITTWRRGLHITRVRTAQISPSPSILLLPLSLFLSSGNRGWRETFNFDFSGSAASKIYLHIHTLTLMMTTPMLAETLGNFQHSARLILFP
jgi:hypothetical protein